MTVAAALWMIAALQAKHLIFDFLVQTRYMYANKGRYGHPGGLIHAALHGSGTICVLVGFAEPVAFACALGLAEAVFHYHVDWTREAIAARRKLSPETAGFWSLLGLDQTVHQWTYVAIILLVAL